MMRATSRARLLAGHAWKRFAIIAIATFLSFSVDTTDAFASTSIVASSLFLSKPPSLIWQPSRTRLRLWEQSEGDGKASVRFSGTEGFTSTTTNPLDAVLTLLASDFGSIALGLIGLVVIVAHRLSMLDDTSADALSVQTRTDLLAVFACGSVLLDGITKLDVTAAMAESVTLEGTLLDDIEILSSLDEDASSTTTWALESLLAATPAKTAVVLKRKALDSPWTVAARGGTVPGSISVPDTTPILDRVSSEGNQKETYLPTLQALPGKKELPYLPANAQLALLIPITTNNDDVTSLSSLAPSTRVLVLGSNRAKSFTPRDVAWCRIVAEHMSSSL